MIAYHDHEWGVPVHDDRVLFEFLMLEGAQAGLSWETILNKREDYRKAFAGFDPAKVARFTAARRRAAAAGSRHRAQPAQDRSHGRRTPRRFSTSSASSAASTVRLGASSAASRCRTDGARRGRAGATAESDALSKELKRRGFSFVGTTICYAFMQAVGMVNDHPVDCFRHGRR